MIYNTVFITLCALTISEIFGISKRRSILHNFIVFTLLIFLIAFSGFRCVGIDYISYYNYWIYIKRGLINIFNTSIEPGYVILNKVTSHWRVLVLMMSALTIFFHYKALKPIGIHYTITAFLFYYCTDYIYFDMGIMRQGLAMSMCIYSLQYVVQKDKRFFLIIAIAMMIHMSSILFLFVYFIGDRELPRKRYYFLILITTIFFFSGWQFRNTIIAFLVKLSGNYMAKKITTYADYPVVDFFISYLRRTVFLILFIELYKKKKHANYLNNNHVEILKSFDSTIWLLINTYFFSVIMFGIFTPLINANAGRLTAAFYTIYSSIYVHILQDKRKNGTAFLWLLLFIILSFDSFYRNINNINGNYIPYAFSVE